MGDDLDDRSDPGGGAPGGGTSGGGTSGGGGTPGGGGATSPAVSPTVTTMPATAAGAMTATLHGSIDTHVSS